MLELSIPQLGEESKHVKDLVFTILSQEPSQSIMQLTNKIKRNYNLGITYQAVRKAVDALHSQNVLKKTNKTYSINKEWVLKLKSFFDKLLTTYETKTPIKLFHNEFAKEDYAVYTFNNLLDLDNFWGDIMAYWADHEKGKKEFVAYSHYSWWFLINLGSETKLFNYYNKKKIKSYILFLKDVPLNHWGASLYESIGVKMKVVTDKKIDDDTGLNILGSTVIQVKYPKNILNSLKHIYHKYKTAQDVPPSEITKLAHETGDIKFIMFKNPSIAKNLRETYKKLM